MSYRDDDDEGAFRGDRGFLVGKAAALADWSFKKEKKEFGKLVNRLRAKKWAKENREHVNAYHRERNKLPKMKAARSIWKKRRRIRNHRKNAPVIVCENAACGAAFCRIRPWKGQKPRYCSNACRLTTKVRRRREQRSVSCPCGRAMSGKRERCRWCAQRARREREEMSS